MAMANGELVIIGFYLPELGGKAHIYMLEPGIKFDGEDFGKLMEKVGPPVEKLTQLMGAAPESFDPLFFVAALQDKLFTGIDTLSLTEKKLIREKINALIKVNEYMENTCINIQRTNYAKYKTNRNRTTQAVATFSVTGITVHNPGGVFYTQT